MRLSKLSLLLVIIASSAFTFSAFADDLVGLNCNTEYVIHDVRRTPYETSRVVIRTGLLGGRSILGYTPVNNDVKDFKEGFNLTDNSESIIYSLEVQEETSILSIKITTKDNEVTLLNDYQFKTKEGFARVFNLLEVINLASLRANNVFLWCLPVYR